MDKLRSIGKQPGESEKSILEKKRKTTVGRICRKKGFKPKMTVQIFLPAGDSTDVEIAVTIYFTGYDTMCLITDSQLHLILAHRTIK